MTRIGQSAAKPPEMEEGSEAIPSGSRSQEAPKRTAFSRKHDRCVVCGRNDIPHSGKGKCRVCYMREYRNSNQKSVREYQLNWYLKNVTRESRKLAREAKHFDGLREAVLERDGYRCQLCGSILQLVVHHEDGVGRGSDEPNNDLSNLKTLCRCCHARVHSTLKRWSKKYDACRRCGTTERDHNARGLCWKCYLESRE